MWILLFLVAVAFVFYVCIKRGLITLGKPVGRRRCDKFCEDHAVMKKSIDTERETTDSDFAQIKAMIKDMDSRMDKGLNELYALMRDYSKSLSDHIGYCRGVQESKHQPTKGVSR